MAMYITDESLAKPYERLWEYACQTFMPVPSPEEVLEALKTEKGSVGFAKKRLQKTNSKRELPPSAVRNVRANGCENGVQVEWMRPKRGNESIQCFTVTALSETRKQTLSMEASPSANSCTIMGLDNDVCYTINVTCTNQHGTSEMSARVVEATPIAGLEDVPGLDLSGWSFPQPFKPDDGMNLNSPRYDAAMEARIEDILAGMTLDEKIGQTMLLDNSSVRGVCTSHEVFREHLTLSSLCTVTSQPSSHELHMKCTCKHA